MQALNYVSADGVYLDPCLNQHQEHCILLERVDIQRFPHPSLK